MVTWSCLCFRFALVPTLTLLVWSLTVGSPSKTMCVVSSPASLKEFVFWGWWSLSLWISLCCIVATIHLFSQSLSIVLRCGGLQLKCHLQLLKRQVYSVARLCPGQTSLSSCHRRHVAVLCMSYKVNFNSNHCLFSELPSPSVRGRHSWAAAAAHPLELEVSRCRTSQFARCFLPAQTRVWNVLSYTVFDTGMFDEFKGAVNCWMLPCSLFFCFPWRRCLWGCVSNLWRILFFPLGPVLLVLIINNNVCNIQWVFKIALPYKLLMADAISIIKCGKMLCYFKFLWCIVI